MPAQKKLIVPNLCRNSAILITMLVTQLFAIVATLLQQEPNYLEDLGSYSLYCQWCSLLSIAILCWCRKRLNSAQGYLPVIGIAACCLVAFLLTELLSQIIFGAVGIDALSLSRFLSRFAIWLLLLFLVIRYFGVMTLLEQRNKAEMTQRLQALQSRIKPHFLFNSLNTISELTVTQPNEAEKAINALSLLFRASLESENRFHTLESEINLCQRYIELERWRLDERLLCEWVIEVINPAIPMVPKLILQPIVENAVVHGAKQDGSVEIKIEIRETKNDLLLKVQNTLEAGTAKQAGNGIAVDNIRERLQVIYDDQQTFSAKAAPELYSVILRFPKSRADENTPLR